MKSKRRELLGRWIRGWLPEEPVASGPHEAKVLSSTNTLVIRVLVPLILVCVGWATLAFIYAGLFVQAVLYLLCIGFILVLILHRTRSIKITLRGRKT
jgi:hypothetical protein